VGHTGDGRGENAVWDLVCRGEAERRVVQAPEPAMALADTPCDAMLWGCEASSGCPLPLAGVAREREAASHKERQARAWRDPQVSVVSPPARLGPHDATLWRDLMGGHAENKCAVK